MSLGGPKTTTTFNQQQNQQQQNQQTGANIGQSTITPNVPDYLKSFYQNIPGLYNTLTGPLAAMGSQQLYGPRQQAQFQQNLGQQYGQAQQNLLSNLASRGALNSGAGNIAQTQLALGQGQQLGNYLAQVPIENRQAQQSALGQLGNVIGNMQSFRPPVIGQTTDTQQLMNMIANMTGSSDTSGTQTQQTSQSLLGALLPSLLGAGMSALTGGIGGLLGGGGFGAGAGAALANTNPSFGAGYKVPSAPATNTNWTDPFPG